MSIREFPYRESQMEAGPVRRPHGLRDVSEAVYSLKNDRSYPEGRKTEEFARLQTARTTYGLGRI